MYRIFEKYLPIDQAGEWKRMAGRFNCIAGYTFLGDLILFNSETHQFALLFTINPELAPLDFYDFDQFVDGYLGHEKVRRHVLQVEKVQKIQDRIGELGSDQIYIAEPYQFLGGDCSVNSYSKGNIWIYLRIIGDLQGVSEEQRV